MERQIHLIIKHSKTLGIKKKEKHIKFSLSFRIFQFIPQPHLKLAGNPSMNLLSSLFDWVFAVKLLDKAGLAGLGLPALNWSSWLRPGRSPHHWSGQPAREHDGATIPELKRQFLQRLVIDATSYLFYLYSISMIWCWLFFCFWSHDARHYEARDQFVHSYFILLLLASTGNTELVFCTVRIGIYK